MRKYLLSTLVLLLTTALAYAESTTINLVFKNQTIDGTYVVTKAGADSSGAEMEFSTVDGNITCTSNLGYIKDKSSLKIYKGGAFTVSVKDGFKITSIQYNYIKGCYPFAEALPEGGNATTKTAAAVAVTYTVPDGGAQRVTVNNVAGGKTEFTDITVVYEAGSSNPNPDPTPGPEPEEPIPGDTPDTTPEGFAMYAFDFSSNGSFKFANSESVDGREFTAENLKVVMARGSGSTTPKYYTSGDAIRLYGGNTLTITSPGAILGVEYVWTYDSSNPVPASGKFTMTVDGEETYEGYNFTPTAVSGKLETYVWEGEAKEIVIARPTGSGHFRLVSLKVIYDAGIDTEAAKEAKILFTEEVDKALSTVEKMKEIMGVNVFQYAPGKIEQLEAQIAELNKKIKYVHTEEGVYNYVSKLRAAVRNTLPTPAAVNDQFILKHSNGMYLSLADGVKLVSKEADATPVSFHNIFVNNELLLMQKEIAGIWFMHSMYIYNTLERNYLGYSNENFKLSNRNLDQWHIALSPEGYYQIMMFTEDDVLALDAKADKTLTLTDATNEGNFCWNILYYTEPEVAPVTPENGESAAEPTAIAGTSTSAAPVAIYSASGARLQSMQKGLNIVKMSDNSVRKVIVK